jgi:hypothetical protein
MTREEERDSLPTHPLLGPWVLCDCGHRTCRYVYPSNIGNFYLGTGFDFDEARALVRTMSKELNQ